MITGVPETQNRIVNFAADRIFCIISGHEMCVRTGNKIHICNSINGTASRFSTCAFRIISDKVSGNVTRSSGIENRTADRRIVRTDNIIADKITGNVTQYTAIINAPPMAIGPEA